MTVKRQSARDFFFNYVKNSPKSVIKVSLFMRPYSFTPHSSCVLFQWRSLLYIGSRVLFQWRSLLYIGSRGDMQGAKGQIMRELPEQHTRK